MMTDQRIAAITERCEAAKWKHLNLLGQKDDLYELIREDIPYLLSRIDEMMREVEKLRTGKDFRLRTNEDLLTPKEAIEMINRLRKAYRTLKEAQRWIPATEPLDTGEYVFVVCENRTLHAAVWTGKQWKGHSGQTITGVTDWVQIPRIPLRKTIREWAAMDGLNILDPDGFDRSDPLLWEKKITKAEYMAGMPLCTVGPLPEGPEKQETYPCTGYECYERGNYHVSCSECSHIKKAAAPEQEGG